VSISDFRMTRSEWVAFEASQNGCGIFTAETLIGSRPARPLTEDVGAAGNAS
jgi:hypothetical protein